MDRRDPSNAAIVVDTSSYSTICRVARQGAVVVPLQTAARFPESPIQASLYTGEGGMVVYDRPGETAPIVVVAEGSSVPESDSPSTDSPQSQSQPQDILSPSIVASPGPMSVQSIQSSSGVVVTALRSSRTPMIDLPVSISTYQGQGQGQGGGQFSASLARRNMATSIVSLALAQAQGQPTSQPYAFNPFPFPLGNGTIETPREGVMTSSGMLFSMSGALGDGGSTPEVDFSSGTGQGYSAGHNLGLDLSGTLDDELDENDEGEGEGNASEVAQIEVYRSSSPVAPRPSFTRPGRAVAIA